MSDLAKQLGLKIYSFRKQSRLTQSALAERAKISNEFMSALERGAKLPSLEVLSRIAGGLRVELKDLFHFSPAPYRKVDAISREALDIAIFLQNLPRERMRKVIKVLKLLVQ